LEPLLQRDTLSTSLAQWHSGQGSIFHRGKVLTGQPQDAIEVRTVQLALMPAHPVGQLTGSLTFG
jgi:hypothetical protein